MKKIGSLFILLVLLVWGVLFFRADFKPNSMVAGGVIPHHLLADFAIDQFFSQVQDFKPQVIVLFGPNHFEKGEKIQSSTAEWPTKKGIVETENGIINRLSEKQLFSLNDTILHEEFSLSAIVPFIKAYFPQAKIVPIIFKREIEVEILNNLTEELIKLQKSKILFIASVDFSHYLSSNQSEQKDQETLLAIKNYDYPKIMTFGNDHLDSPASLTALLLAMQKSDCRNLKVLYHGNSGEIIKKSSPPTTSYFSLVFR